MEDLSLLTENDLADLTIREFGKITSIKFTTLFERGIHTVAGLTFDSLIRLYNAIMKYEPEDWQIDFRDVTIKVLVTTHRKEIEIFLLDL